MRESVKVSVERIKGCVSFTEILRQCFEVSGRSKGEVAWDCGWKDGGRVLSRILTDCEGDDRRWMPHDKLIPFMVACGNAAPLWWLMMQLEMPLSDAPHYEPGDGFAQRFAAEQTECKRLLTEVLKEVKSSRAFGDADSAAQFCLVERDVLPDWLSNQALDLSRQFGAWLAAGL